MSKRPNLDAIISSVKNRVDELEKEASASPKTSVTLNSNLDFTQDMLKLSRALRELDTNVVTLDDVRDFANSVIGMRHGQ